MSLQALGTRIASLGKALEQSLANHNALAGRLAEAQEILGFLQNIPGPIGAAAKVVDTGITAAAPVVEDVVAAVDPSAAPTTTPAAS
jgi:hypothetical protein